MTSDDRYKLYGVYLSPSTVDSLAKALYDDAGVVDLETYFEESQDAVPVGDPGADATDELLQAVLESFAPLYDRAAFDAARTVDPNAFSLVHLAAKPRRISELRERFQAAATIQESDLRTVQTAILAAYLETDPSE
ncbi:hypothetical protein [Natronorubrum daqingense]|uniref:Uncharacterized protein n=1 Tax=Natronorubrum daqingense TaxID=588898 RepID=A0A1N7E6V2_9EURY|nr:hypothetical protein [Natronorubrum daqingense]APX96394.1 hypothetical protein BB347_07060 [Natronorubrum daqingense]SIR83807.1 hypothetical protein SAMN05421809_2499 [Natronorubrum daqingense]